MRQVLLAIMLMGAAFAGGAVVNGPGPRWVREHLLTKGEDDGEAAVPEGANPSSGPEGGIPSAPVPSLVSEAPPAEKAKAEEKATEPAPKPSIPARTEVAAKPAAPAAPEPSPGPLALNAEPPAPVAAVPPLEPPVDVEAPKPEAKEPDAKVAAEAPWSDAPGSAPAGAVPPKPFERDATVSPAGVPTPPAAGDWAALRRKMQALGVARYGFDGEPGGRVRFHCVIPLAGRRAVGQQFEAEGDDEFQAAQTALRRVALWQATENK